jgi:serine protease inhibitor
MTNLVRGVGCPPVIAAVIAWTAALLLSACGTSALAPSSPAAPPATPHFAAQLLPVKGEPGGTTSPARDTRVLVEPLGRFGLTLLSREAAAHPAGNVVLSPASIADALTMTLNGARGETAAQMQRALGLGGIDLQRADQAWADLIAWTDAKTDADLRIANSLWLKQGYPFVPAFLQTNRDSFAADTVPLPADPTAAVDAINGWVDQRTDGRIPRLVSQLDPATVAVLVNATLVKAGWVVPFRAADTRSEQFTLANGTSVRVPTMHAQLDLEVATTPRYEAVTLPANGVVEVTFIVPKGAATADSLVTAMARNGLGPLDRGRHLALVDLALPRFKATFSDSVRSSLEAMGMTNAFSTTAADFSGMATARPLWIDDVVHQAVLDINEKGVEAAAGTAVFMAGAMPQGSVTVRVDRPFVAVLTVGTYPKFPLFVAVVRDPRR